MALYRYVFASVVLSQRYLPPILLFFAALAVGTSGGSGPLLHSYAFCLFAVTACSTWLTAAVVNHESPVQRQVVIVTAGSAARVLIMTVAVAFTGSLFMVALGLVYPILAGRHAVTAGVVTAGAVAELSAALLGVALGLLTSRLVIPRLGVAVLVGVGVFLVLAIVRQVSPLAALVRLLDNASAPAAITGQLAGLTAISAAVFAAAAMAAHLVASRRE
jgi:hypothetical protein